MRLRSSLLTVFLLPFPLCEISRTFADHKQILSYQSIKFPFLAYKLALFLLNFTNPK